MPLSQSIDRVSKAFDKPTGGALGTLRILYQGHGNGQIHSSRSPDQPASRSSTSIIYFPGLLDTFEITSAMAFEEPIPLHIRPKPLEDPETGHKLTYKAQWARLHTRDQLAKEVRILQSLSSSSSSSSSLFDPPGKHLPGLPKAPLPNIPGEAIWDRDHLPSRSQFRPTPFPVSAKKVCIVGAGITGLYIALILDTLALPNISFDFFEASDRVGGRCMTHNFSEAPHDYYDVGAMRFPRIEVMRRTFDLFNRTNTETIPYYLSKDTVNCPMLFHNTRILKSNVTPDWTTNPFRVDGVTDTYAKRNPGEIMAEVLKEYVDALNDNPTEGFKKLMTVDQYSVREYLSQKTQYNDYRGIEYLETFSGSTTSFNGSFSEKVFGAIDFAADDWVCVKGGMKVLIKNTLELLRTKPQTKKKVTRIEARGDPAGRGDRLVIDVKGESSSRTYDTVFCTTTLGCLQKMDLTEAELNWGQKCAIRALTYGAATKVAIKFSRPWWITDCGIIRAGLGSTDELIRTCVYPSYNLDDDPNAPAVLLCSYCWQQDALRLGSLVHPDSPKGEDELKEVLLRGLARMHDISYDLIAPLYMTHHAWNWYQDPNTMGAYANFGPADFRTLYPYLVRPSGRGLLHFAGEAMSANHGWIVGSLESAYRAVSAFFEHFNMTEAKQKLVDEFGPIPEEIETGEKGTEHLQNFLGSLDDDQRKRLEHEMLRYGL
ncbi:hypothetical protein F4861DRAFT_540125 [Xylaria intraflava]|nr:hypothetical protein F4861DRAFT_540125 [Xylaria intraflava]